MSKAGLRLLFLTAEHWPTFRADVAVLFGSRLAALGVRSDLVALLAPDVQQPVPTWPGGEAQLRAVSGGQARRRLAAFMHGLRCVWAMRAGQYDAVQVRDMPVLAAVALLLARFKQLPFFYWMSYPMPEGQIELARERGLSAGWMKFLYPWVSGHVGRFLLYRMVLRNADHVFVQSPQMALDLTARGVAAQRMTPVPMGVDFDAVDIHAIEPAADVRLDGRRVLVYLGTLDRPRQIEQLFDMLVLLRQRRADVILVLAGDTEDHVHRQWLRQRAQDRGVTEHVVFTGWLPMQEAWRYLKRAEIGLSPFPRGFLLDSASPTKVPEYLMFGVPVVCNDNPDQAALIKASGSGRCVPYTPASFAAAVDELLDLPAEALAAMGQTGRARVAEWRNYRRIAADLAAKYDELLAERFGSRDVHLPPNPSSLKEDP